MIERMASYRRARAFQLALERLDALRSSGTSDAQIEVARAEIAATLGDDSKAFLLATALSSVSAPAPDPTFVEAFSARLRALEMPETDPETRSGTVPSLRSASRLRRPTLGLAPLAVAACTILFAALMIPAYASLPGERLYGLKGAAEDARVWLATGHSEAVVRVGLANKRFEEVEALIERARVSELAASAAGSGHALLAASRLNGIDDPRIAALIEATLAEAGRQLEAAAEILTNQPAEADDLDELVVASSRGQDLVEEVAEDLPKPSKPPVVRTAVKLAKIEAKAKAARMNAKPSGDPTPEPCDTPSPSPTPTAKPSHEPATSPSPTSGSTEAPGADEGFTPPPDDPGDPEDAHEEQADDSGTSDDGPSSSSAPRGRSSANDPCRTPSPSPTPTEEPEPTTQPEATPASSGEPSGSGQRSSGEDSGVGNGEDEQGRDVARGTEEESADPGASSDA